MGSKYLWMDVIWIWEATSMEVGTGIWEGFGRKCDEVIKEVELT